MLSTQNLCFSYTKERATLKDININLSSGKITGIIGANGSGKSTLFMNLLGILKPTSGCVCWNEKPIGYDKKNLLILRQNVAMVFQDPDQQIFYTDVKNDVSFSLRNLGIDECEINNRVNQALTMVDALSFADRPVHYLSFGQKKRVAIAGALVLDSPCILLDEPTAGLDPQGREQMVQILETMAKKGKTVVVSSHDIDLIYQICDEVYVLQEGTLLDKGNTQDIFLKSQLIQDAGLTQPWLIKLHLLKGYPLYQSEEAFFKNTD